jgi:hypothetical protein
MLLLCIPIFYGSHAFTFSIILNSCFYFVFHSFNGSHAFTFSVILNSCFYFVFHSFNGSHVFTLFSSLTMALTLLVYFMFQSFRFGPEIAYVANCCMDTLHGERQKTLVGNGIPGKLCLI